MQNEKKRVGFVTSSPLVKTGFSNNISHLLPYLYKTGKYELFLLNQELPFRHAGFERYPWHNEGAINEGTYDKARYNKESGYKRFVNYGNAAVESWIIRNKLDVVIHIQDIWSSHPDTYYYSKWWKYLKNNFLQWTTADSLPLLPMIKDWAANCPNMWFWSSFAERELKKEDFEKYGHVRTLFGAIDTDVFKPISKQERDYLRFKNNIDFDTKLFIQLGRNQLRKLFPCALQAFSEYKRRFPKAKAKLLFHTNWDEKKGFPIQRLIGELGLQKEDVLSTYYCKNCFQWQIKPYEGEDVNCGFCKSERSQQSANINTGISNEDLNKIYGICDASLSIFTSGGMEYTNPQSLLCKLPLLCSDYSCGEDFVKHNFVWRLDGTFTFEPGSGFMKHVPNIETIVRFFKNIEDLSETKKELITQRGRDWAIENFNVNKIGKVLEDWIDSTPNHNWDFEYPIKDPGAFIPNIENNSDWIKLLYQNILKGEVKEGDEHHQFWMDKLNSGLSRTKIENHFRKVAQKELEKDKKKPSSFKDYLDDTGRKRYLMVLKEAAGDILMSTALFRSFKEIHPDWDLYFACDEKFHDILAGNEYIYKILPYEEVMENEMAMVGYGNKPRYFDGYAHLGIMNQRILNYISDRKINLETKYA